MFSRRQTPQGGGPAPRTPSGQRGSAMRRQSPGEPLHHTGMNSGSKRSAAGRPAFAQQQHHFQEVRSGTGPSTAAQGSNARQHRTASSPISHSRGLHTPNSNCSTAVEDLEETIVDVMGIRMQSLSDLRARIEELSALHRQEEATFRQQMAYVLERSEMAKSSQIDIEQDYQMLLKKEREEREALLKLMQRFKEEGAQVIRTMKESLQDARGKWKAEVELNARLTAQLRSQAKLQPNPGVSVVPPVTKAESDLVQENQTLKAKIVTLTKLIEEEDSIIVELQQRNRSLEQKVGVVLQQRDRLLDLDAQQLETAEFNTEYNQLLAEVRGYDQGLSTSSPHERVEVLTRFSKLVMQRLLTEQRQRLRVEEQAARMASAQDQLIHSLELRIKDLESNKDSGTGRAVAAERSLRASSRPRSAEGHSQSQSQPLGTVLLKTEQATPSFSVSEGFDDILNLARDDTASTLQSSRPPMRAEPVKSSVVPLQQEPRSSGGNAGSFSEATNVAPSNQQLGAIAVPYPSRVTESVQESPSKIHAGITSLEEQLASVTSEFQQSVSEWNQLMSVDGNNPLRESDFFPEEA